MTSHHVIPNNLNEKQLVRHVQVDSLKIQDNKQYNPRVVNPTKFVELDFDQILMKF
jgi:hypothetical protein